MIILLNSQFTSAFIELLIFSTFMTMYPLVDQLKNETVSRLNWQFRNFPRLNLLLKRNLCKNFERT